LEGVVGAGHHGRVYTSCWPPRRQSLHRWPCVSVEAPRHSPISPRHIHPSSGFLKEKISIIFFWRARVCWPLLCYVAYFVFLRDVLIRAQRAAASRRATKLAIRLTCNFNTYLWKYKCNFWSRTLNIKVNGHKLVC
jgi:hypothetical protein